MFARGGVVVGGGGGGLKGFMEFGCWGSCG